MNVFRSGLVVVVGLVAASSAVAASKPITLALKLPGKGPAVRPALAPALSSGPVWLDVADGREADDPTIVGAERESGIDVYFWRTQQPLAPAVKGFVGQLLTSWSVSVAASGNVGIAIKLTRYYVHEKSQTFGSSYSAEVALSAALVDGTGTILWTREGSGKADRTGVDGRASTCNELLSLALRDALAQALAPAPADAPAPAVAPVAAPVAEVAATTVDPGALFNDLVRLKAGGVAEDVLVTYVTQHKLSRQLTVDEILAWKNAGIPDAAIKAAVAAP